MSEIKILEKDLNLKKISTEKNNESILYLSDKYTVCKIPKNERYNSNIIRSYYIGKSLNSLQYLLPNFIQTHDLYKNKRGQLLLFQEYVKGETFEEGISKLTFSEFLNIFIQILLALEVARQYYNFIHYDLHLSNIILKPLKYPLKYTIKIAKKKYTMVAFKYLPIIIDFGYSYIEIDDEIICPEGLEEYGIYPEPFPSIDMYKLLFHSYVKSKGELQKNILKLFFFYGGNDPYNILETPFKNLTSVSKDYFRKIKNKVWTPLEFIFWICQNSKLLAYRKCHFQVDV